MTTALWYARTAAIPHPELQARYEHVLDPHERARYQRFYFEPDRHVFLLAHALLRYGLSHYHSRPPEAWRFVTGPHGKPALDPYIGGDRMEFSLSHTRGMAICAFSSDAPVGADVEPLSRWCEIEDISERYFLPDELRALSELPEEKRCTELVWTWTSKEAELKRTGEGLSGLGTTRIHPNDPRIARVLLPDGFAAAIACAAPEYTTTLRIGSVETSLEHPDFRPVRCERGVLIVD